MLYTSRMQVPGALRTLPRRWVITGAVVVGTCALVAIGLIVVYPRVGAWMIRTKVGGRLQAKLGREVRFGAIDVSLGHAVIRNLEVRGPHDGDTPLVHIDRIDVDFDATRSLYGKVLLGATKVDGVIVSVRRDADGTDNVRDVVARLQTKPEGEAAGTSARDGMRPTQVTVTHARMIADDQMTGATALVSDGGVEWKPGELTATAFGITATTLNSPKASATKLEVHKVSGQPPTLAIEGGEIALSPRLALSGIGGKVTPSDDQNGAYTIDLAGGYGGVPGTLWTAKGGLDVRQMRGSIDLVAAKFQLDRLSAILANSPVVDFQSTSVDTNLHVEGDRTGVKFAGGFHLVGLNIGHPMLADKEVHDLDLSAQVAGSYDRTAHKLDLTRGDFIARDVPFSITGTVVQPRAIAKAIAAMGKQLPPDAPPPPPPIELVPAKKLTMRLVIPSINCQRVLNAIPTEMAPYMAGYKLTGMFDTDVLLDIDWSNLDATVLDGHVGIKHCKVVDEPPDSPKRLKEEFEHYVEVDKGEWTSFIVGPSNDDFVPIDQISPYVMKSIMTTEDSGFYVHHGFITSEFRTALVNDLKAGGFKYGASSITMQMVKNVLLYREKTLARKLQELFLTWHVENTLTKDRIMEIYLNVIEYGPGLYGIGPASWHFFSKPPRDLNPVEAAFFSSILPAPKERYKQYCAGTLTKWTTGKIERILGIMLKRDRLTQVEYDSAMATPLLFAKDGSESEDDCMKRVKKAIKNARSTNPLRK